MAKPKVKEVIVVEGRYDKNTLSQVVDAVIIETSGFGVFNNKEKQPPASLGLNYFREER